tara:strand:- start:585 stop:833 length:249 start_codon:yes stop_codon:yes gene_type:complete
MLQLFSVNKFLGCELFVGWIAERKRYNYFYYDKIDIGEAEVGIGKLIVFIGFVQSSDTNSNQGGTVNENSKKSTTFEDRSDS